jgi:hypothetical protein
MVIWRYDDGLRFPLRPEFSFRLLYGQIVDAGKTELHVAKFIKLPVLIPVSPIPLPGVVVEFVLEADGDAVLGESPEGLLQAVIEFAIPFAPEEFDDLRPAMQELGAVTPLCVLGVGKRDALWIAGVPSIFGGLDFLMGGFFSEGWKWRAWIHFVTFY